MPNLDLFYFLKNLYLKTTPVKEKEGQPDSNVLYVANRYLSQNHTGFFTALDANRFSAKIPQWAIACLMYHSMPKKHKAPYIEYLKKEKDSVGKEKEKLILRLGELLCCNYNHAKQSFELLEKNKVNVKALFGGYGG